MIEQLLLALAEGVIPAIAGGAIFFMLYQALKAAYRATNAPCFNLLARGALLQSLALLIPLVLSALSFLILEDESENFVWLTISLPYLVLQLVSLMYFYFASRELKKAHGSASS